MTNQHIKKDYTFEIPGEPIAKKRPRFCSAGKKVMTYDIQKQQVMNIKKHLMVQIGQGRILSHILRPISLHIHFYMPIPESWSQKRSNEAEHQSHCVKPDLDNLIKMYCDAMNGLVYEDDAQIASISSFKRYSKEPKTVIYISTLQENEDNDK